MMDGDPVFRLSIMWNYIGVDSHYQDVINDNEYYGVPFNHGRCDSYTRCRISLYWKEMYSWVYTFIGRHYDL